LFLFLLLGFFAMRLRSTGSLTSELNELFLLDFAYEF
jgi:hypothetical protein